MSQLAALERAYVQRITVERGTPLELPVAPSQLSAEERRQLEQLVNVAETPTALRLTVKRQETVGTVRIGRHLVTVEPRHLSRRVVLGLVLIVNGITDEVVRLGMPELGLGASVDWVAESLAGLLVTESERALRRHVAQGYIEREEPLPALRGRPLFQEFGRTSRPGFTVCRYEEKTTNVGPNRLLLAGIKAGRWLLTDESLKRRAVALLHALHSIADDVYPTPEDFDIALRNLNRQSIHYADPLRLARAVIFGHSEANEFVPVPGPVFEVWKLFQGFLARVLTDVAEFLGLAVTLVTNERRALVDRKGDTYREVIPDIVLTRAHGEPVPVAVLDAKYKPQYLAGGPGQPGPGNRVSNGDIYQVLFYAEDLRARHALQDVPPTGIVSPLLEGSQPAGEQWRLVRWPRYQNARERRARLLACPVTAMVEKRLAGGSPSEVLAEAPELDRFLRAAARRAHWL